jgi:hypothetical protein
MEIFGELALSRKPIYALTEFRYQRLSVMRAVLFVTPLIFGLSSDTFAQYCANYNDGSQSCGIPTFQSCLQSVSGVGGSCGPDNTSQLRPNLMQRLFNPQQFNSPAVQDPDPAMPPPPTQN